jgi:hypothetical protein
VTAVPAELPPPITLALDPLPLPRPLPVTFDAALVCACIASGDRCFSELAAVVVSGGVDGGCRADGELPVDTTTGGGCTADVAEPVGDGRSGARRGVAPPAPATGDDSNCDERTGPKDIDDGLNSELLGMVVMATVAAILSDNASVVAWS